MKKYLIILLGFGIWLSAFASPANAVFTITVDGNNLDFGTVADTTTGWQGSWKELPIAGNYYNQVTCTSDKGARWSLKVRLTQPLKHSSLTDQQFDSNTLKWMSTWTSGTQALIHPPAGGYVDFTESSNAVYVSAAAGADVTGTPVNTQFKYAISLTDYTAKAAGNYTTTIEYIFIEE